MLYMKTTSGDDGSYTLTVSFALGTDPDINTVNVNNRVQIALSQLPTEVQEQGLVVQKIFRDPGVSLCSSPQGKHDPLFISNYAIINLLDPISRTPGVGHATLLGTQDYSMRIWFDPHRLTGLILLPPTSSPPSGPRAYRPRSAASAPGRSPTTSSSSSTCRRRAG